MKWNNLDNLEAYRKLTSDSHRTDLKKELGGADGAQRVAKYQVKMAAGLSYNYAAKAVDAHIPLTQSVLEMMKVLHHDGDGACDHSALLKYYQKLTGEVLHH